MAWAAPGIDVRQFRLVCGEASGRDASENVGFDRGSVEPCKVTSVPNFAVPACVDTAGDAFRPGPLRGSTSGSSVWCVLKRLAETLRKR